MVHESTVYFERCHAAELDDAVSIEVRTECWERWLRWYSQEQTQTRVLYARERIVFLSQGEIADPLPSEESADEEAAAPAPIRSTTEAIAPPSTGSVPTTSAAPSSRRRPRFSGHDVCEPVCLPGWNACVDRCVDNERTCIAACQNEYGSCMSGCI